MKIVNILILLFFYSTSLNANNLNDIINEKNGWKLIDHPEYIAFYNEKTVVTDKNIKIFHRGGFIDPPKNGVSFLITQSEIDCNKSSYRESGYTYYYSQDNTLLATTTAEQGNFSQWQRIPISTIKDFFRIKLCTN